MVRLIRALEDINCVWFVQCIKTDGSYVLRIVVNDFTDVGEIHAVIKNFSGLPFVYYIHLN